jgi:hypothetical protein
MRDEDYGIFRDPALWAAMAVGLAPIFAGGLVTWLVQQ